MAYPPAAAPRSSNWDGLPSVRSVRHGVDPYVIRKRGTNNYADCWRALREGIPDLQCPVEEVVAEGDRVAGRFSLRGTHDGTLLGIPATGKRVDVGVMVIARFDHRGKWNEDWASWDQLGLLQQIGVVPAPAAA